METQEWKCPREGCTATFEHEHATYDCVYPKPKAVSVLAAIKKEKHVPVHDAFIDEKWQERELAGAIGFDDGRTADEE